MFIKEGFASANCLINFDQDGKITNYQINGKVNEANLKFNKLYNFENINFNFTNNKKGTSIINAKFNFKKIKFFSDKITIPSFGKKILVNGDLENEKITTSLKEIKSLFKNDLNFITNQEITFKTKNEFF